MTHQYLRHFEESGLLLHHDVSEFLFVRYVQKSLVVQTQFRQDIFDAID